MEDHEHLSRHAYHRQIGGLMAETDAGHPWACVVYFYAAFHLIRWALLRDPRFDDVPALKRIDERLIPDDRHVQRHKARGGIVQLIIVHPSQADSEV